MRRRAVEGVSRRFDGRGVLAGAFGRLRTASVVTALLAPFALVGCPAEPIDVERPAAATPCTEDADCNPGRVPLCGLIRACVDARCEREPTRTVHCPP